MKSVYKVIKIAIEKGKLLQGLFPELREIYLFGKGLREGYQKPISIKDLARICLTKEEIMNSLQIRNEGLLENTVRYALVGNADALAGETYPGLLTQEEYYRRSAENRRRAAEITYALSVKNRMGALFQSEEERRNAARKAAISRGQKPWTEEEIRIAYNLKEQGLNATEIGRALDRTRYSVLEMFRRESRKKKKQERGYPY